MTRLRLNRKKKNQPLRNAEENLRPNGKYTHPKECEECPLSQEGLCQKIFKMKNTKDLQGYTAPDRGSVAWKKRFKKRTAVERVNAYLKEFLQLYNVRYRSGERTKVHGGMVTLIYNASKLAADCIDAFLNEQQVA
ncbi:MAG TPA: transposase [Sphingobacterium sp.]|nr:transposase [Sphingobacterium sp.]